MKRIRESADAGFTLVELLVAMLLFSVVSSVAIGALVGMKRGADTSRQATDLNEEGRLGLNRMVRELRQATDLVRVVNPDLATGYNTEAFTSVTFKADFDGDGCINGVNSSGTTTGCLAADASNPELVSYCYDPGADTLAVVPGALPATVGPGFCSGGGAQQLLSAKVSRFELQYRSNLYLYDTAPADGITTWRELDAAGGLIGNVNGALDMELPNIDAVVLKMTMKSKNGKTQSYRTQVDLRNKS